MSCAYEPGSREWTRCQVEQYMEHYDNYKLFADTLEKVLRQIAKIYDPLAIIQTRAKAVSSFAEKCQRKKEKYKDPVNQLTDLCGGRMIVHTAEQVKEISDFIKQHFEIDQENSIDVTQRLKPAEFGYRSVHYIVSFRKGPFKSRDRAIDIPPILTDDKEFKNRRAELQVRTILEHAWADTAHELAYKSPFKIPVKWQREFAGIAAMLEGADKSFSRIIEGLSTYAASYGSYMTEQEMRDEIELLEIVLDYDQDNIELVGRIGKLAIILGDWDKAIKILSQFKGTGAPAILRDLGVALCKKNRSNPLEAAYLEGQRYLETAGDPPHEDIDAIASLAGTYKNVEKEKARELYRRAFLLDPSDPYPLENYIDSELNLTKNISITMMLRPVIESAVKKCAAQAEVGVNLPWAYFMMGKFYLLMNKPYEGLENYAKAVQLSPACWMPETALDSLEKLETVSSHLTGYEWSRLFLLMGQAVLSARESEELHSKSRITEDTLEKEDLEERAEKTAQASQLALAKVKQVSGAETRPLQQPVVIVAGGCDASIAEQMKGYEELVLTAFSDYEGTVIGGGTTAGISGLIGTLAEQSGERIITVGYLPLPEQGNQDGRYKEVRLTKGSDFSPLEPLHNWIDLLSSGIKPASVKVLGINGGPIAAIEYRIALALGATVGIIEESGREAALLFKDERWSGSDRLIHLPKDPMTVKAFIGSGRSRLEESVRDKLAREIHKQYRQIKETNSRTTDPSLAEWDKLPKHLQESNAHQADHIFEKLKVINCTVHKISDREINICKFTDEEIELLSEVEHGRWNVERLLDGWTWGEKKDVLNKKSPYLVSWAELSEEVREWDRATVRKIPEFLASIGLEIVRN